MRLTTVRKSAMAPSLALARPLQGGTQQQLMEPLVPRGGRTCYLYPDRGWRTAERARQEGVTVEAVLVWPLQATLGEGPLWVASERALWFTDIKKGLVHRYQPAGDLRETFVLGGQPGFIVRADDDGLIVGMDQSLHRLHNGKLGKTIATVKMPANNRLNDANVDARGRLWFGSMDDGCQAATGAVHLYERGRLVTVGGRCVITNGPGISPDGKTLYHVDTVARTVTAFDIAENEQLKDGRVVIELAADEGAPDGVIVDAEGCLWLAVWGGWCVRRYNAEGVLLMSVKLPCAQITKLALGGPNLTTAYITTARLGLSETDLLSQPLAGALFTFEAPVPGLPAYAVELGPCRY